MTDTEIRELLAAAATQAADASHVLFVAAQLAQVTLKNDALSSAEALKVTAAAEAARVVALAAVEAEDVLRKGRASALLLQRLTPQPLGRGDHVLKVASLSTLGVAALMLCVFGWWLLFPYSAVTKFTIHSSAPTSRAGELYRWTVSYCVDAAVPLPIVIEREIEFVGGKTRFPIPRLSYVVSQPCETFERSAELPLGLRPGLYHLHVTTGVTVNPLRVVYQTFQGDTFEVVP